MDRPELDEVSRLAGIVEALNARIETTDVELKRLRGQGWFAAAPPATALLWWGATVPDPGWWFAAGQAVDAGLYPVCASVYGSWLPDLRNRFLVGAQGGVRPVMSAGGSEYITYQQMPAHTHGGVAKYRESKYVGEIESGGWFSGDAINSAQQTDSAGGGEPYWPRYLAVNMIIKMG